MMKLNLRKMNFVVIIWRNANRCVSSQNTTYPFLQTGVNINFIFSMLYHGFASQTIIILTNINWIPKQICPKTHTDWPSFYVRQPCISCGEVMVRMNFAGANTQQYEKNTMNYGSTNNIQ